MHATAIKRVPHILFLYWVIKIASTTLGETGADMFSMTFSMGYSETILIFLGLFSLLLLIKLRMQRYDPVVYWLLFTASAIAGTAISDFIDRTLGLGYAEGSAVLVIGLILILGLWHLKDKSISVEHITSTPTEVYYWMAFLIANTLGTAAGDYVADQLGVGFLESAIIFTGILVATALLHFYTRVSKILIFWVAFVITRPFGATFGDLLTKSIDHGGLNLGTIGTSLFFATILFLAVHKETRQEKARA